MIWLALLGDFGLMSVIGKYLEVRGRFSLELAKLGFWRFPVDR